MAVLSDKNQYIYAIPPDNSHLGGNILPVLDANGASANIRFEDIVYLTEMCRERFYFAQPHQNPFNPQTLQSNSLIKAVFDYDVSDPTVSLDVLSSLHDGYARLIRLNPNTLIDPSFDLSSINWPVVHNDIDGYTAWHEINPLMRFHPVTLPELSRVESLDDFRYLYYAINNVNRFAWTSCMVVGNHNSIYGQLYQDFSNYHVYGPIVANDGNMIRHDAEGNHELDGVGTWFYQDLGNGSPKYTRANLQLLVRYRTGYPNHPPYNADTRKLPDQLTAYLTFTTAAFFSRITRAGLSAVMPVTLDFVQYLPLPGFNASPTQRLGLYADAIYAFPEDTLFGIWNLVKNKLQNLFPNDGDITGCEIFLSAVTVDTGVITKFDASVPSSWNWTPPSNQN